MIRLLDCLFYVVLFLFCRFHYNDTQTDLSNCDPEQIHQYIQIQHQTNQFNNYKEYPQAIEHHHSKVTALSTELQFEAIYTSSSKFFLI